jgi:glutamate-1-semialdehyde 2,1-aminomutase
MAAGLATLREIEAHLSFYDDLERRAAYLESGIVDAIVRVGAPCCLARVGSMWTLFFTREPVRDWPSASRSDRQAFARFFHAMLQAGVVLAPSQFEANFVSAAHTEDDLEATVAAVGTALDAAVA